MTGWPGTGDSVLGEGKLGTDTAWLQWQLAVASAGRAVMLVDVLQNHVMKTTYSYYTVESYPRQVTSFFLRNTAHLGGRIFSAFSWPSFLPPSKLQPPKHIFAFTQTLRELMFVFLKHAHVQVHCQIVLLVRKIFFALMWIKVCEIRINFMQMFLLLISSSLIVKTIEFVIMDKKCGTVAQWEWFTSTTGKCILKQTSKAPSCRAWRNKVITKNTLLLKENSQLCQELCDTSSGNLMIQCICFGSCTCSSKCDSL